MIPKKIHPVTLALIILCVIFAGLIVFSYAARAAKPAGGSAGGQGSAQGRTGQSTGGQGSAQGRTGQGAGGGAPRGTAVRTAPVARGTIETSVIINGDVLAGSQVSVYPNTSGKLAEARAGVGDRVRAGETLAMIDPSRPGDVYAKSPVVSPVAGTVLAAPVNRGDTVSVQTAVYVVGDLSRLLVEAFVPERFSAAARKGLPASARFEALGGGAFPMAVEEVAPALDPASRTVRVRLGFLAPDPRIKAGMFATITLVTDSRAQVLTVPRSAAVYTYGEWVVFVANGERAERREITIGLESEALLEVTGGLVEGERLVVSGQHFLSDGDSLRLIQ